MKLMTEEEKRAHAKRMSDYEAIAEILEPYNVPEDVVMEVVGTMWERETKDDA